MTRVLITGINGSAASYLAEYLARNQSFEIHGTSRSLGESPYTIHQCDLTDLSAVLSVLKVVKPDYIFHLASNADVKMSYTNPIAVFNNNTNSTLILLEGLRILGQRPIFQMCSTSEVYGKPEKSPIDETFPLNPANIYAVSKLAQEKLARFYWESFGIPVVITRAFGYINPRRKNIFSTAFAMQIARIEKGLQAPVIKHGNLDSIRTLLDVSDIVRAYWMASCSFGGCKHGEAYNIGSEHGITVQAVLDKLVSKSTVDIKLELNQDLLRPNDITLQIPDVTKFKKATNFYPTYSLDESLDYLLTYCREKV